MAFKMNGWSVFKHPHEKGEKIDHSKTSHDTGGVGKVDEKTAKQKYEEALAAGKVKPDYFNNFMYKLTGNIKWKIRK